MPQLPDLCVGWQACDPGPTPRSHLLDHPPSLSSSTDIVAAHRQWRVKVERDEAQVAAAHNKQPIWFPMHKNGRHRVVPVMGGTTGAWDLLIAALVIGAGDTAFDTIRVANLMAWPVLSSLQAVGQKAKRLGLRFDTVSASGSTLDLFAYRNVDDLASFVVDVLRVVADPQGRRDSAREKADLVAVGDLLEPPQNLGRLTDALDVALGQAATRSTSSFSKKEERDLRDFHARVVTQRRQTADRLDGLQADLRELRHYGLSATKAPLRLGATPNRIRAIDVDHGGAIHEFEIGREILARSMARVFAKPRQQPELLIIAGADKLAPEVLENLTGSAEQLGKQLVLLFSEITPLARRTLGAGGSDFTIFLRLPNADDAEAAARHLGKEFTFVVNGISIADGHTDEWNTSYGTSNSTTSTRGQNSGTHRGIGGGGLNLGRSFGTSVSEGFTQGTTETRTTGGGRSSTVTQSAARVHDYIVQPEQFQNLAEDAMLVVEGRKVVLGSCDYRLRNNRLTSKQPLAFP